jgi:hypothetical protein
MRRRRPSAVAAGTAGSGAGHSAGRADPAARDYGTSPAGAPASPATNPR